MVVVHVFLHEDDTEDLVMNMCVWHVDVRIKVFCVLAGEVC